MKVEDLSSLSQLAESMRAVSVELGRAIEKHDAQKIKQLKGEISNLQKEVDKIISENGTQ